MHVITHDDLRTLVPMLEAIDAMAGAFAAVSRGEADEPMRIGTRDGGALAMLATCATAGGTRSGTVFKAVGISPENRSRGLPSVSAVVLWLDPQTAMPSFLVDGTSLTALRTGAASGLATRLLAAPDASTLAMIGAGGQAADQVRAVCSVRPIETVRICSSSGSSAERLAARLSAELPGIRFEPAASADDAIEGADVVSCATNAISPLFDAASIEGRVHVNAVGSYRPEMRELPAELLRRAEIVAIDQMQAALSEAGELIALVDEEPRFAERLTELGRLVAEPTVPPAGVTVFKSVGIAMQDWAICNLLEIGLRERRLPAGLAELDLAALGE
jgi:ornithine cyclodeaminase